MAARSSKSKRTSRMFGAKKEKMSDICETKKLKDIILDSDEENKCEKYVRLTDDNINNIEHKLTYTFGNYAITQDYSGDETFIDETEREYCKGKSMIRNAEGILQDKNELRLMKRREKLTLLKKLKAEIRKKKKEEKDNQLFKNPKWWMYLMKNGEDIITKSKMKKPVKKKEEEEFRNFNKKLNEEKKEINIIDFLNKRSKRRERKREEKAMACLNFWENLEKERKDLRKMMLAVELKKYMIKSRMEKKNKLKKKIPKKTLSVILINLKYLELKRKQCNMLRKKNFNNIIGATDEEVNKLKSKLNEVKDLFKKRNDWTEDHLISLMNLSKKVSDVENHKNSLKEEVINYYVDGVCFMMDLLKQMDQDISVVTIRNRKIYDKIYRIMKQTEAFIGEQILVFGYLRNVLLHAEWTYLYYPRMRVIRLLDEAVNKIKCLGFKPKRKSVERLKSDSFNEIICEEPEYKEGYIRDNPKLRLTIHTKDFRPISDDSII